MLRWTVVNTLRPVNLSAVNTPPKRIIFQPREREGNDPLNTNVKVIATVVIAACLLVLPQPGFTQDATADKKPNRMKVRPSMTDGVIAEGSIIFNYVDAKRRRRLTLDLYRPENPQGLSPAIVMYFGGGWQNGRPGLFAPLAQALAQRGYVCVVPEYRLSGEAPFPAAVHDAKAAVRWTRKFAKRFKIDPQRIACIGGSAGGHLSGFVAATSGSGKFEGEGEHRDSSSEVQAAIVMCGPMNLLDPKTVERVEVAANTPTGHAMIDFLQGETPSSNEALYREASPLTHVGSNAPPMLFIDGEFDNPRNRYMQFRAVLDRHGIVNEFVMLPKAPHPFWAYEEWFEPTVVAVDDFLKKHLK